MNTDSTFWADVDKLTSANHRIIQRDHGTEVLTTNGLLQQLRDAIGIGMEGGGSSTSFGSRPPIDPTAQDLLLEINSQAREAFEAALGRKPPFGAAEKHIRLWAAAVNESTMVTVSVRRQHPDRVVDEWRSKNLDHDAVYNELLQMSAWRLLKHWIERIESFFFPPDTREIQAACPACGERHFYRQRDGQTVQSSAMLFVRVDGEITEAKCSACGSRWLPFQFEWLAKAVGAQPLPELVTSDTPM